MKNIFIAVRHLTNFSISSKHDDTDEEVQQSLVFFPLVGFYIGCFLVLINFVVGYFLPGRIVDIFLVLFLVVFTGAKHLKGLLSMVTGIADFSDIKSMASNVIFKLFIVLFFTLFTKYLLINSLVPGWKNTVLLVMPVIGRWSIIFFPYLSQNRSVQNFQINPLYGKIKIRDFWIGTTITAIIALLLGVKGIIVFMLISFVIVYFDRFYQKKANWVPENLSLGVVEIAEIMTLIFFIILESRSRSFISHDGILL